MLLFVNVGGGGGGGLVVIVSCDVSVCGDSVSMIVGSKSRKVSMSKSKSGVSTSGVMSYCSEVVLLFVVLVTVVSG